MPIPSTSGFDISSDTCCKPISASPLDTKTLTRPSGPPAASFTLGVTSAAMPSRSNSFMMWAAVMPPPAGARGVDFFGGCAPGGGREPLEQLHDVGGGDAAARGSGVSDGFRGQQRALERFGRRDIRPGRALAHTDADAGARDSGRVGQDLALPDQIVERAAVDDDHVGGLAADEASGNAAGRSIAHAGGVFAAPL